MSKNEKITRPTEIKTFTPRSEHGCKNGWYRHMGSDYPCGQCQDSQVYLRACKFYQVDPETLLSLPAPEGNVILWKQPVDGGSLSAGLIFIEPGDKLTELLVQGWEFVPRDIYEKRDEGFVEANPHLAPLSGEDLKDIGFREMAQEEKTQKCDELFGNIAVEGINHSPVLTVDTEDADGLSLLDRIVAGKNIVPELPIELAFTKSDIEEKLDSDIKYLDHAFKLLGKDDDNKSPRTRFYRFVTGDYSDEGKKYKPKSLSHVKAERCFGKFCSEDQTVLELAKEIAVSNWTKLEELLTAKCYKLPANDDVWLEGAVILNMSAKALQVEGYGWLPKSKCRFVKGKLVIPGWLSQSIKEKQAAKNQ